MLSKCSKSLHCLPEERGFPAGGPVFWLRLVKKEENIAEDGIYCE